MAIWSVFVLTFADRGEPFQYAVEIPVDPSMNPVPAIKTVKDWLPAVMLPGYSPEMIGVGFGWVVVPLDPQLDVRNVITASTPSAVHRKRIKPVLL
ncbi:MAG: hypothetical protein WA192_12230 [Candidatus Acidiferrales bacterium]